MPRDHAWHGGKFYQSNEYNEWHYITVLGRDVETDERISIFWVPLAQGWMAEDGRPLHNVLFAFHNLDTGEFHTSMPYITGPLKTEGSAPDADDFWFKYSIDDGKNGFTTAYDYPSETWNPHFPALRSQPPALTTAFTGKAISCWWVAPAEGIRCDEIVSPASSAIPAIAVTPEALEMFSPYPEDERPIFFGHYFKPANSPLHPERHNVACLDHSAATGGPLVAYRWKGESKIKPEHYVASLA